MSYEEVKTISCNKQSACDSTIPTTSDSARAKKVMKKTVNNNRNKANKCSVCKKVMRSDTVKRRMISKHSRVLNSNQLKKVIWDARPYKDYHKSTACSVCGKVMRDDNIKRHMNARHKDVLSTTDAVKKQSTTNGKTIFNVYDQKVASATSCALTTVTSALHWAFKHIHDETVTILERNGERDASKRTTSLLMPIEEQLTIKLNNDINRVANLLILRASNDDTLSI